MKTEGWFYIYAWLCVAIGSTEKQILQVDMSFERTMLIVAERFIASLINTYGKHPVSTTDGGTWYPPQACRFLKLKYHLHSSLKRKALSKGQSNISRIELNALMTIFHAKERNVN